MFKNRDTKFVSYGEVLFDVFGNDKKIGGAPLNIALRIKSFGFPVAMISAIGNDEDGKVLKDYMTGEGLVIEGIMSSEHFATGLVNVKLNERGSATYTIDYPSAWDKIEANDAVRKIVSEADVFLYGSLVCRDEVSRNTLFSLLENGNLYKVFDANLRPPHYEMNVLKALMDKADFIKLNDEELFEITEELGSCSKSIEENMRFLAEKTDTDSLCVTKGKHGAVLLWKGNLYYNAGFLVKTVDTVGAGDSFLASLITKLKSNEDPQEAIDFACAVGAMVAGSRGANPKIEDEAIRKFLKPKQC